MTPGDVMILSVYGFAALMAIVALTARLAGYWWTRGKIKAEREKAHPLTGGDDDN